MQFRPPEAIKKQYKQPPMLATGREVLVFDIEVYSNFFLVVFKSTVTGKVWRFQKSPRQDIDRAKLEAVLANYVLVGFNSRNYDIPLIQLALDGYSTAELKEASDDIIVREMSPSEFREHHHVPYHSYNHVDLIEVAPLKASLKIYGGRLHCKRMQDLPIDPSAEVTAEEARKLFEYCCNDLDNTGLLWKELQEPIMLREQLGEEYGQDLRSRSDAQIAEHVIAAEVAKLNGEWPKRPEGLEGTRFQYKVPDFIQYQSTNLQALLENVRNTWFEVEPNGSVLLPDNLAGEYRKHALGWGVEAATQEDRVKELNTEKGISIGFGKYKMGIGGLHSTEKCVRYVSDDDTLLIDRDVASYYPSIILNQKLYPAHMGLAFLHVYDSLVKRRLAAKKRAQDAQDSLDTLRANPDHLTHDGLKKEYLRLTKVYEFAKVEAESLKITINGSFGKLGSKWSSLYSPDLMIQVTITGQLALLMFIEMLELAGIEVVSANTDGVLSACPKAKHEDFLRVVAKWEHLTGFKTDETRYRSYYARDVNNYVAIKEKGGVKTKGAYANPWSDPKASREKLQKNPSTTICIEAAVALLEKGTPIKETIRGSKDITKFVAVRTVKGGAKKDDEYLGKAIRWYYAEGAKGVINCKKVNKKGKNAKVPKSDNTVPLMELPKVFPDDIAYPWYIAETQQILIDLGFGQATLF